MGGLNQTAQGISVRDAFFNYVYELSSDLAINVITSDLGAPSLDGFRRDYLDRYISVGISEQNLIATSAGLVQGGMKVIAYGLNPFPITRAYDQVRNYMSSMQIPIILTGLNVGTCSAEAGYSHMPIEDYTITRCLTGIITIDPSCTNMSRKSLDFALEKERPIYIRFDKRIRGELYQSHEIQFQKGFISRGIGDILLISYGFMATRAHCIQKALQSQGISIRVLDIFSSEFNRQELIAELRNTQVIFTLEDGVLPGGFGSMILELINDAGLSIKVIRKGLSRINANALQNWEMIHKTNGIDDESLLHDIYLSAGELQ